MKTIPHSLPRATASGYEQVTLFAFCLAAGLAVAHAAPPSLQPLLQGKWPKWPRGYALNVQVVGNYAYVALGPAGLGVFDVSDPTHCVPVSSYDTRGWAGGVAVLGNYAYVADRSAGLQVIDVSNPAHCVRVGGYDTSGDAVGVAVSGNYAYVADGAGLHVVDVSNPANCVRVGGCDTFHAVSVAVTGNYAYVAGGYEGLQVIDVSDPANCVRVGGYSTIGSAVTVTVSGNYAYMVEATEVSCCGGFGVPLIDYYGGLRVIDIRTPTNCVRVGGYDIIGYDTSGSGGYGSVVALSGNYAYVAKLNAGLQVIDVSNPTNCVRVGGYDTGGFAYGVAVDAGRIYVADGEAGLLVLPTLPNVQFTVRVDATPGVPFTLETATNLNAPIPWTPLLTTNVPSMPFDYVDFDVKLSEKPHKFYRVRQP